ncbi:glycosyltransferase family 4 protein [Geobacter sp. DSM 9736]|uniref:glycosyltransferase family 4 protein n=1 Tax=Geobacter sp. DSM 9736 TaxID=1277350 RepID=UPI000B62146B|nr:glycosyltransferase family 4 protein [Geobacter sp. DSM 9736]SNB47494.1 Glycosyltransferase involved in cell wall bisynthesis [Geobacter sp. DSM 9736]
MEHSQQALSDLYSISVPSVPRRVLMTADTVGGVWTYALEVAQGLARYGIEVLLATMGGAPNSEQRREARRVRNLVLHDSAHRLEWMDDPWEDIERAGEWLLSLEDTFSPDVVHLNGYVHAALPWRAPCLVAGHSCVLSWWESVRKKQLPASYHVYRERVRKGLSAASLVVTPTRAMLGALEKHYLPLPKGRVIHNARNRKLFKPGRKEEFILCVGRIWDEAKNVGSVARAAANLAWPVYIAGEEKHPEGGTLIVGNVSRLGKIAPWELAAWLERAGIYAHPAKYEPFGLSILEAAMSRCALVLGDIPSLRELWEGAAVFVPPDDTEALKNALQELCTDHFYRERLAGEAYERSMSFSLDRMAAQYMDAYLSLHPAPMLKAAPAPAVARA